MIFRYGEQVVYPVKGEPDGRRGWVCKPPVGHPVRQPDGSFKSLAPPYYEGGAFVLSKAHNSPMWFDGQHLKIVTALDRLAEET